MTGPEHYDHAEQLLFAASEGGDLSLTSEDQAVTLAAAQVHATLALAAATYDANQPERITAP